MRRLYLILFELILISFVFANYFFFTRMDVEEGEKPTKKKHRGMTRKSMLIKNRTKGIKLSIKYNLNGIFIGELVVHLTSYLGILARTMVPITYKTWHVVPK